MDPTRRSRIALGSLFIECNQLGGVPTDLACFERCELRTGDAILEQTSGVVGGLLDTLASAKAQVEPLIVATACPSGPLTAPCYQHLKNLLLQKLRKAHHTPLDGLVLALHGAALAEGVDDLEGDLLNAVRQIVGPDLPIVATLDLHAHITAAMIEQVDALVAWETYPHKDTYTTGQRGARLLIDLIQGKIRPTMAMAKVPVLVGSVHGNTEGAGPFADLMRAAKQFERLDDVLSTSMIHGYPYLDQPGLGSGALVVTNNDLDAAERIARELAELYWEKRLDLEPEVFTPEDAIRQGLSLESGPVLLVETADCCGGGAAGDSVHTLKSLVAICPGERALVPVVDPRAAHLCHQHAVGDSITCTVGHRVDPRWGTPIEITGKLAALSDGQFRYDGGIWEGQVGMMGPSAVLQSNAISLLITSDATYDWADEQFRSVGLAATEAKFVVVKNPMNFRVGYADIATACTILDTPGPTPATLKHMTLQRVDRPYFPADPEIPGLRPTILRPIQKQ